MGEGAWRAWKEETFGTEYMIWHDGLPVGIVERLRGEARAEAVRMLKLGVSLGDSHAAQALSAMGEHDAAAEIAARLPSTSGSSRVRTALALHALAPDPELSGHLLEILRAHPVWGDRLDAAIGLRAFPRDRIEEALLRAVSADPEYLVRYHAAESLLASAKRAPRSIVGHPAIFEDLRSDDPERWPRAAEALRRG